MGFGLKIGMLKHAHEPEMLFFVHYRKELVFFLSWRWANK